MAYMINTDLTWERYNALKKNLFIPKKEKKAGIEGLIFTASSTATTSTHSMNYYLNSTALQ